MRPRAVVVGAGTAGCVLAARIADRYDVVVVEAGRRSEPLSIADASGASAAHPPTWSLPARLTPQRSWKATPGRAVGGSSVVNGGYFATPDESDLALWREAGGPAWEQAAVRAHIDAIAERLGVRPAPADHPVTRAFAAAAAELGREDGLLPLRTTIVDGMPRSIAAATLPDAPRPVEVRSDCRALRVVVVDGCVTGVEVADGAGVREVLAADEVVLCAGALGSARLLLNSGLGPAADLRAAGIDLVADLPGVGAAFSDHPTVWVEWMPGPTLADRSPAADAVHGAFPLALRLGADGGGGDDLELLACILPPEVRAGAPSGLEPFGVLVGLQRPTARGTVAPASAHPLAPPRIDYGYLADERDRAALRAGVRRAAELVTSSAFEGIASGLVDLDEVVLGDDERLNAWIADRLGSAAHTCGTAPMGPADDPLAVVDGAGRVRGVAGLRIADTSILPVVPARGPAAAAMAVGAVIADRMP